MDIVDIILSFLSLGFGCFGFLPIVVAAVALIDAFRVGADWYWYIVILAFPVVGSVAYFVVVRSPLLGRRNTAMMSPAAARRLQARRRLRELQVQLSHWRGPAVLAEAGEELLVLGKPQEAEKHLRESRENGGGVEDVNYGLAQALEMQGRWAEAAQLLEELVRVEPDSHLGEGPLHLGRSLDEAGRKDEAEAVLRKVLERRTVIEAQVRLARILFLKGNKEEAGRLLSEVLTDAKMLPRYLKRRHGAWIRTAKRLKSGTDRLPKPAFEGTQSAGYGLRLALAAAGALVLLTLAGGYLWMQAQGRAMMKTHEERQKAVQQIDELERRHPWTRGEDLGKVDLTAADLDRYLSVRKGLEPALREIAREKSQYDAGLREPAQAFGIQRIASRWNEARSVFLLAFAKELSQRGMGPRELDNLTAMIEWRFLRRPSALIFGLPAYNRQDWLEAHNIASGEEPEYGEDGGDWKRWHERSKAKAAALEREAAAAIELSPATRGLFEDRRSTLERLNPQDAQFLARAVDPMLQ